MSGPIYCELSQIGLIRFSGDDAQAFLHNQLTCDVAALATGSSVYGAYSTPKGRMLASFLLWRSEQGYFMQLPSSLREPVQKNGPKFILRSKVQAADASSEWTLIGVAGKDADALVQRVIGQAPQGEREVAHTTDATIIACRATVPDPATKDKAPRILDALAAGAEKVDAARWEWLDIRAGIPTITPATQESFVPQMVNLDLIGGVSFEKGATPARRSSRACTTAEHSSSGCFSPDRWNGRPAAGRQGLRRPASAPGLRNDRQCRTLARGRLTMRLPSSRSPAPMQGACTGRRPRTVLKLLPLPYAVPAAA